MRSIRYPSLPALLSGCFLFVATTAFSQEGQYHNFARRVPGDADTSKATTDKCLPAQVPSDKFSIYEPNYFLTSFNHHDFGEVKFKISFKYNLGSFFHIRGDNIYFAYTQQTFWDLYDFSSPIRDVNFRPMLHVEHTIQHNLQKKIDQKENTWRFFFNSYKGGALHESNGQAGISNRSLFQAYAHFDFAVEHKVPCGSRQFTLRTIEVKPWIWTWIGLADDNSNIANYRGYGQLLTVFYFDWNDFRNTGGSFPLELNNLFIPAGYVSDAVSLVFNPVVLFPKATILPNLYAQYWHGYGESLLNYDNRFNGYKAQDVFRLGIQFRFR